MDKGTGTEMDKGILGVTGQIVGRGWGTVTEGRAGGEGEFEVKGVGTY